MPDFNGNEGTIITLSAGAALTAEFRKDFSSQPLAIFFGKNKLNTLLAQSTAVGIRCYFGEDTSGNLTLVLVAANASCNDLTSCVLDTGMPCPTACSTANSLNS